MEQTRIINGLTLEDALKQFEPMVYRYVRDARTNYVCNFEDLVQEGRMAIVRAFNSYKDNKGASLATWMHRYITGAIWDYQKRNLSCLARSSYVHQVMNKVGENATREELKAMKLEDSTIQAMQYIKQSYSTADFFALEERADEKFSLDEYLPFVEWKSYLTDEEVDLIERHFGFRNGNCEPMYKLAEEYGVSRSTMANRFKSALNKLRRIPGIEDYYYV